VSVPEAHLVKSQGEVTYNQYRLIEAVDWVTTNPGRFIQLTSYRTLFFWFPPKSMRSSGDLSSFRATAGLFAFYAMTGLGSYGLFRLYSVNPHAAAICLAWVTLYPLPLYLIQSILRYRAPIFWLTFALGSIPVLLVLSWTLGKLRGQKYSIWATGGNPGREVARAD
jgi:hypothetical protein